MAVEIRQLGPECLEAYATISMAFRVESVLRVEEVEGGLGGLRLVEESVSEPYVKDYDAFEDERPTRWRRFDLTEWGFFMAFDGEEPVGGAVVAVRSSEVHMLEGREDLAVLKDIRVAPERRGQGIGTALWDRAIAFARDKGCTTFKVETQNVNVAACRFYAARGCRLGCIDRHGYAGVPEASHETMLLWYKDL